MKLYMAVTADKYELPVIVEEDIRVFAKRLGIFRNEQDNDRS